MADEHNDTTEPARLDLEQLAQLPLTPEQEAPDAADAAPESAPVDSDTDAQLDVIVVETVEIAPDTEADAAADAVAEAVVTEALAETVAEAVVTDAAAEIDAEPVVAEAVAEAAAAEAVTEPVPTESEPAAPVTAVSLGLLPAEFVSQVSTQLMFYAPEVVALPARPGRGGDAQRDDSGDQGSESGSSARRRNRRRGGGGQASDGDDAPSQGERPGRQPRQRAVELITEPQRIKGSTRLEAKKQRRRDGREAGRRRTVVTEAEFLARREAVDRDMIVRSKNGRVQIAVLEDNVLVEHYVARSQESSLIGNVYLGRVQNVLPSMEAAFVDIGRGRNAVLYSGEVDWDAVETGNQPRRIELALKSGDRVLVQVTKDPVGHKGARLTSQISLPGRYLVYVPGGAMNGISRKLPDTERARLKRILKGCCPSRAASSCAPPPRARPRIS